MKLKLKDRSVVSYEELMNSALECVPDTEDRKKLWDGHVRAALALKDNLNSSKMAIAEIAERACLIFRGGAAKGEAGKKRFELSLKKFATDIKIPYKTLGRWTVIKKRVFENLPKNLQRDFRIFAADKAAREIGTRDYTKEEIVEIYENQLNFSDSDQIRLRFLRDVGRVRAKISKIEVIMALNENERDALRAMALATIEQLNRLNKIADIKAKSTGFHRRNAKQASSVRAQ